MKHSSGTEISLEVDNIKGSLETDGLGSLLVIAGLHACGDLSANMLRTFIDCEQVKALICLGCCYNLLSEGLASGLSGFPMSNAALLAGSKLGKSARDIACQSAERWKSLIKDAALQNFDVHAFCAAFQMVLFKYFPRVLESNPSIGRQGKALRRQRYKRTLATHLNAEGRTLDDSCASSEQNILHGSPLIAKSDDAKATGCCYDVPRGFKSLFVSYACVLVLCASTYILYSLLRPKSNQFLIALLPYAQFINLEFNGADEICCTLNGHECPMLNDCLEHQEAPVQLSEKFMLFEEFTKSGLDRLGYSLPENTDLHEIWDESLCYNAFFLL